MIAKYAGAAATAARHALSERWDVFGRAAFFGVLLLIYSNLWATVFRGPGPRIFNPVDLLWYLALTEWIVLSVPPIHVDVEQDVRSGDIAYLLPRPLSYAWGRLAEATGTLLMRMAILGPVGFGLAWALAGALPDDPARLLGAVPLCVGAAFATTAFHLAIGLTAFWIQDAGPVFWIWQKLSFVLGGLIFPLAIYPDWLRGVAAWLPFQPLVGGAAGATLGLDDSTPLGLSLRLVGWGLVALLVVRALYARGLRVLDVNGG